MNSKDLDTLHEFISKHPTWWYRIGVCDISRDFTAAPQAHSPEANFIKIGNIWDNGFTCDHSVTISDAIHQVIKDIEKEILTAP